jgi:hypothetical protein
MSWLKRIFNGLVDSMERYNQWKTKAILANSIRDPKEVEKILKDMYR